MSTNRQGATLVELLVALMLGALVVSLGGGLMRGLTATLQSARAMRERLTAAENGRRELELLLTSAEAGTSLSAPMRGSAAAVELTTWRQAAGGWPERQRVLLHVREGALVIEDSTRAETIVPTVDRVTFHYLASDARGPVWLNDWTSTIALPEAVEVILERGAGAPDTVLVVLGPRG
jgi:Tfp pilus assembly protein PilW